MRLVATCLAAQPAALAERLRRASRRVGERGLVEARLDLLARPVEPGELSALAEAAEGRLLATCRPGGTGAPATASERRALLERAAREGAAAVDAEEGTPPLGLGKASRVVSLHLGGEPTPEEAAALVVRLGASGAAVLKLAAPAADAVSALRWMRAAREAAGGRCLAAVPLGPAGRGLRLLSARGLSDWLYCAEDAPAAAGQARLDDVLDLFAADRLGEGDPVLAVVGHPLTASWSPALHSGLLRERGGEGLLVALPVREPAEVLPLLEELGVRGAAVTMPHKAALSEAGVELSERARRAGSVNTLRRGAGGWQAESFDGAAAVAALEAVLPLAGRRVAILGAGGAAAALGAELGGRGVAVTFLARREAAAAALAERLGLAHAPVAALEGLLADVVVNATPGDPGEPAATRAALDMRTTPADSDWLRRAAARGLVAIDGLSMLARQAAAQQRWWWPELALTDREVEERLRRLVAERGESPA